MCSVVDFHPGVAVIVTADGGPGARVRDEAVVDLLAALHTQHTTLTTRMYNASQQDVVKKNNSKMCCRKKHESKWVKISVYFH